MEMELRLHLCVGLQSSLDIKYDSTLRAFRSLSETLKYMAVMLYRLLFHEELQSTSHLNTDCLG